jgi:DNA helicase-2/ATP-dependent DNA helicase PcrA
MHGVKGNEFDNVIVNIEEVTPWNWYDFAKLLKRDNGIKDSIKCRTEKLLYVACTRAKCSLVINYIVDKTRDPNTIALEKENVKRGVLNLFGEGIEFIEY